MVFAYFIETSNASGATPFNILPVELAYGGYLLELPAVLPSSRYDLSDGWVRARHILARMPWICFYSEANLEFLTRSSLSPETECILFFASNNFSCRLIEKFSQQAPCIVVTDNLFLIDYFKTKTNIQLIQRKPDDYTDNIFAKCYQILIKTLSNKGITNFSGKRFSEEFQYSYSLKKSFLPPINISNNFLCIGNEVVFSQVRGKFPNLKTYPSAILSDFSAFNRNVHLLEEVLSERLVDILLGIQSGEQSIEPKKVSPTLGNYIKSFLADYPNLSDATKRERYNQLKEFALSEISQVYSRNEITLLLPTVNLACRVHLLNEYKKRVKEHEYQELVKLVDAVLLGGRGLAINQTAHSQELRDIFKEIGNTRISENRFLTYMTSLLSSRKLSPILKATTAPSSLFNDIMKLRVYVSNGYLSCTSQWCLTTGQHFRTLQRKLTENIPPPYLQALDRTKPSNVTIVSDLPFELAQFENGMAICQTFPTTRIPITPLSSMFRYSNLAGQMGAVFEGKSFLERILLINSLQEKEPAYKEFEIFMSTCVKIGLNFKAVTVTSGQDFISEINQHSPSILIYFGHGLYDEEHDEGQLVFKNGRLSFTELDGVRAVPNVIFLFGCETASCNAFFGGLPSHLLEMGVFSIIATIFPIPGYAAGSFLGRVLAFLDDAVKKNNAVDLSEIIFQARKLGWIMDNLIFLVEMGAITWETMGEILLKTSETAIALSLEKGYSLSLYEGIEVFKEVLKKNNLLDVWEKNKSNIVLYSLFFTVIGDCSNVMFGGQNTPKHTYRRGSGL